MKKVLFVLGCLLFYSSLVPLLGQDADVYQYILPFQNKSARYFFYANKSLYLADHPNRTLYRVTADNRLLKVEDVKGWYALDATFFQGVIVYCSRDRVFFKEADKVQTVAVAGANSLISITASDSEIFLLDEDKETYTIRVLDSSLQPVREFACPAIMPLDFTWYGGFLWLYDAQDRCVKKMAESGGAVLLRIYTGVDNRYSQGIVFVSDQLYVHNRESSSLIRVDWEAKSDYVTSGRQSVKYAFVQEMWNNSQFEITRIEYKIPLPPVFEFQKLLGILWEVPPASQPRFEFDQQVAVYPEILVEPRSYYKLSYTAEVSIEAVQYTLAELPLDSLATLIPAEIRQVYLAADKYLDMENPQIIKAAQQAALGQDGASPAGVRELIENIAYFLTARLDYLDDDTWESAAVIINKLKASCSEYSFLFAALCRLNRVPARFCGGFETRAGSFGVFHRWTEVWYPGTGWIPVDVTKMDAAKKKDYDLEHLFGQPDYLITLYRTGSLESGPLGVDYSIRRHFRGGDWEKKTTITQLPASRVPDRQVVQLVVAE